MSRSSMKTMIGKQRHTEERESLKALVPHLFSGGSRPRRPHYRSRSHLPSPLRLSMMHNNSNPSGNNDQEDQSNSSAEHQSVSSVDIAPQGAASVDKDPSSKGSRKVSQSNQSSASPRSDPSLDSVEGRYTGGDVKRTSIALAPLRMDRTRMHTLTFRWSNQFCRRILQTVRFV